MVIQNFDMLDLVANGDHRLPPHPNRRPNFHYIRALSIRPGSQIHPSLTSSVHTLKLFSVLGPKVLLIGTSVASRPRAISTRPMRGVLFRASKVYQ